MTPATPSSWTRRFFAMTRNAVSHVVGVGASEAGAEDGANSKASSGGSSPSKESGSPSSPSAEASENGKNRANSTPASPAGSASNGAKTGGASAEENGDMALLKGKKVLKTVGSNKVMEGYVESYIPAKDGQEEKWLLKWDDEVDEEVTKAELDKWINLHNVRNWSKVCVCGGIVENLLVFEGFL